MKTLRVQLYVNRISDDLTQYMEYMYQYNIKHDIILNFDITQVNVSGYKSLLTPIAAGGNGYVLTGADSLVPKSDHDIVMFLFDLNEWKSPWYSFYPLRSDVPRSSCIISNGKPFINLGFYSKDIMGTKISMIHELMHSYNKISGVTDQMDTYYKNDQPDAPDSNFAIQWKLLKSWIVQLPSKPVVTLQRMSDNGVETLGLLTYGSFMCNTMERPWKDNKTSISCIPKGTYQCSMQPFHSTKMYELSPTSPRTGIFIHIANYVTDLEGCIGLGVKPADINHDGQIDVTSSKDTVNKFIDLMGGKPFTLIIK